jgi:spore coat polysaccharide biosynthesis protein SpsF
MAERVVAVVQARMGSSRLPGKVLLPLAGRPLLVRMLERVVAARSLDAVVVATTTDAADAPLRAMAPELERALGVTVVAGHPTDLLDRHVMAGRALGADVVVKIPSDCPLVDPAVIDCVVGVWRAAAGRVDFVSNLHPPTWPDGNDVEVMSLALLERAAREATQTHEREHTTPWIWDQPGRFRLENVAWDRDLSQTHRLTIDYPSDHALIAAVYDALWRPERPIFGVDAIVALLDARPDLRALNAAYAGVNWYRNHLDVLRTVDARDTRQPPADGGAHP